METKLREELHKITDEADDVRLQEIYDWLHEGVSEAVQYTHGELEFFYRRLDEYTAGNTSVYTAEEFFAIIMGKKV